MKFLLQFVQPCFGYPEHQQQLQPSAAAPATANPDGLRADETRTLMRQSSSKRRRKRGRVAGVAAASAAGALEWRPSLSSISEHVPAVTVMKVAKSTGKESPKTDAGERQVRRKSGGGWSSQSGWVCGRSRGDDFGRKAFETVVPAFPPTPFMF